MSESSTFHGDIVAHVSIRVHNIPWLLSVEKKTFCTILTFVLLNFSICHLLESPDRGDFNGML